MRRITKKTNDIEVGDVLDYKGSVFLRPVSRLEKKFLYYNVVDRNKGILLPGGHVPDSIDNVYEDIRNGEAKLIKKRNFKLLNKQS